MAGPRQSASHIRQAVDLTNRASAASASLSSVLTAFARREAVVLAGLVLLLNITDLLLTHRYVPVLARELNPFMSWALDQGVFVPVKLLLTVLATLTIAGFQLRRTGWTAVLISTAAVGWNLGQLLLFLE